MARKGQAQKDPKVDWRALNIIHPDAAGIDIGSQEHWVAISPDKDERPVRAFECFTADVERMADWLESRGVRSVAMQSTGVYWMPVLEILQQRGMEVFLVNARHTKNLPGRKSDIAECQWLLKLHTFGLLNNSFQPSDEVRALRTLWRHRSGLVAQASSCIQRMQKALIEMNVQLSHVLSDLSGVSGLAIVDAILGGERSPEKLASLVQPGVKASQKVIAKSLQGNWREELLFILRQEVEIYRECQNRIKACDEQLQQQLRRMESKVDLQAQPLGRRPRGKRAQGNAPQSFDLRSELYRLTGVDWVQVDGFDVQIVQTVTSEVGFDLRTFPDEKHFANWLGLCPTNETSGGKVLKRRTPKVANRAATAFRQAASTLLKSKSYLGAQYRRLRTRLGAPKAMTAMARKLACLFYRLITKGSAYVDKGVAYYETRHREQQVRTLIKKAQQLGLQVIQPAGQTA